ncbi:unnamed protein product [Protopolystoma xenopodis]|uniref:Uncharacterized protein n=1 Tax=Protopolystoma xenopodis TaxID=117903 RepID=A0A3S5CQY2_9PLAT|nr:unnamed protein product [Protopolystoma xenopodis]
MFLFEIGQFNHQTLQSFINDIVLGQAFSQFIYTLPETVISRLAPGRTYEFALVTQKIDDKARRLLSEWVAVDVASKDGEFCLEGRRYLSTMIPF